MTDPARRDVDVTDSVMRRLGYERAADPAAARRMRLRRRTVLALQATAALLAVAAAAAWWLRRADVAPHAPVGDALRGSVAQGAERLDAVLLGLPRPGQRPAADTAGTPAPADAATPRTY
ncbi:MAG: hypothetical protein RL190_889 [Actinomycetota bacterium]